MSPLVIFSLVQFTALIFYFSTDPIIYMQFTHSSMYYSSNALILHLGFIFSFLFGAWSVKILFSPLKSAPISSLEIDNFLLYLRPLVTFLFYLTLLAYAIWFGRALACEGLSLIKMPFESKTLSAKYILETYMIKGVTTLTQIGPFLSMMCILYWCICSSSRHLMMLIIIVFLSVLRVLYFGERLACMEILFPLIVLRIRAMITKIHITRYFVFLTLAFSAVWSSELIRSYPVYADQYTPWQFLSYRLFIYFVSSINNFWAYVDRVDIPQDILPQLFAPFYGLVNQPTYKAEASSYILNHMLTPEYNTFMSFGNIYMDFGLGGMIILFFLGGLSYYFFYLFQKGTPLGLLVYPLIFLTILDSCRITYLALPRGIIPLLLCLFTVFVYRFRPLTRKQTCSSA